MSKSIFFTVLISSNFIFSSGVFAASEDGQRLSSSQRSEEHRKRKPDIAEKKGIKAALKALRANGALQRASRQRSNSNANTRINNRLAARAAVSSSIAASTSVAEDNETVIAIKHVLLCKTENHCQTAHTWAINNDFRSNGVLTSNGHGGETMYHLFLRQEVVPDENSISGESSRVHEGVKTLDGIRYATWMLDLDPEGEYDNGGNQ